MTTHQILELKGRTKVAAACVTCGTRCAFTTDPEVVLAWVESHSDGDFAVIAGSWR
jgi:hypothetical protein